MTKTFYLTGDRSMDPANSVAIVGKAVAQLYNENKGEELKFITGNHPGGIEFAARFVIAKDALGIVERPTTEDGYIDWDLSHKKLVDSVDKAIVLHGDPLGSRIGKSVSDVFPEDKVRFLIQESA